MSPTRFNEALEALHRSTETLAGILGCDESRTEAYLPGLIEVPVKLGAWLETWAQAHEVAEDGRPAGLRGGRFEGLAQ